MEHRGVGSPRSAPSEVQTDDGKMGLKIAWIVVAMVVAMAYEDVPMIVAVVASGWKQWAFEVDEGKVAATKNDEGEEE